MMTTMKQATKTRESVPTLGLGIGWRPELAVAIDRDETLSFVEITGEHFPYARVPEALLQLQKRGRTVIPHGISVSLGSAEGFSTVPHSAALTTSQNYSTLLCVRTPRLRPWRRR